MARSTASPTDAGSSATPAALAAGFDYELPPELIAQEPVAERDGARLLVVSRDATRAPVHSSVLELLQWLRDDDLLVVNRSRVIPARLRGRRAGGGSAEILLIAPAEGGGEAGRRWKAMVKPARRLRPGQRVALVAPSASRPAAGTREGERAGGGDAVTIAGIAEGFAEVEFSSGTDVADLLARLGEPPLPPYIRRPHGATEADRGRYQTVFAAEPGSIAAPTAGLHLSHRILAELRTAGVEVVEVVLHVGPATFLAGRPGRAALAVEPERYWIPEAARAAVVAAKGRRRVIAVGTTTTRALEAAARSGWPDGTQTTDLVLAPGAPFRVVDGLLTNFHLPGSSLLALVSAFAGVENVRRAYLEAVAARYRFYSYGDAMLLV